MQGHAVERCRQGRVPARLQGDRDLGRIGRGAVGGLEASGGRHVAAGKAPPARRSIGARYLDQDALGHGGGRRRAGRAKRDHAEGKCLVAGQVEDDARRGIGGRKGGDAAIGQI